MSESFDSYSNSSTYRDAAASFSTAGFLDRIEAAVDELAPEGFTSAQFHDWCTLLCDELERVNDDDVYRGEVFVVLREDDVVYRKNDDDAYDPVSYDDGTVLYGYVRDFVVRPEPGQTNMSLMAEFGCFDTDGVDMYLVPLVTEGDASMRYMVEAPVAVVESDVGVVDIGSVHDPARETAEQELMHDLLNLVEYDVMKTFPIDSNRVARSVQELLNQGVIVSLDEISTATNYYLEQCRADGDPWIAEFETHVAERLDDGRYFDDGTERERSLKILDGEHVLEGVEFFLQVDEGVQYRAYVLAEDGARYCAVARRQDSFRLFRGLYDGFDDTYDTDESGDS